jgi:uncharacterized protein (TIGR02246 family)
MKRFAIPLLLLAALCGCQTMSAPPNLAEVEAVERARFQTWVRNDVAAMELALADDALYCHSNGQCQSKKEFIAEIAAKQRIYRTMDVIAMTPKAVGGAVLINGTIQVVAEVPGRTAQFRGIYTSVYVKRDGRWQLVSWQSTTLP